MTIVKLDLDKKMLEYSISEFRNIPEYIKICEAFCIGLSKIQDGVDYLSDMINLNKAEGVWLDYIGWLVGTTRSYADITRFFCVNAEDLNELKYFWFKDQSIGANGTLDDEYFRRKIYAKIGYNTSKCTRNENIKIIKNMTFANHVIIDNTDVMTLDITLYGDNILETQDMIKRIESILGDGVGVGTLSIKPLSEYTG